MNTNGMVPKNSISCSTEMEDAAANETASLYEAGNITLNEQYQSSLYTKSKIHTVPSVRSPEHTPDPPLASSVIPQLCPG